ncbi:hypothetical protein [Mycoplasma struthionis]|uniref:Uncharacterized protein n=1 Tax=Mycoplasma struthionis TaxID=538220 RepID=A0A3G8LIH8_9MOLU|nr:hypothetical protein [Mycoplasma struthionis]AZG68692.1 hypothetical protein EGN60_01785 [Mycoplasma struthionis]
MITFVNHIASIYLITNYMFNKTSSIKKNKALSVLVFLAMGLVNLFIIGLAIGLNLIYSREHELNLFSFKPVNILTIMTPYVLLVLHLVAIGFISLIKVKKLKTIAKKEDNGSTISS